jgi:DnaJ-class molecular chaperone
MKGKSARKTSAPRRKTTAKKASKPAPRSRRVAAAREAAPVVVTEKCDRCHGQGCVPVLCPKCHGRPSLMTFDVCRKCKGIGFIDATCPHCRGTGEAPEETEPAEA